MKTTKNWLVAIVCALGLGLAACSGAAEQEPSQEVAQEPADDRAGDEVDGKTGTSSAPLITRSQCERGGGHITCGFACLYTYCTGGNPDYQGLTTYAN